MIFLSLLAIMMMTMPAYAQGAAAPAPTTNWVAIASGFGMAIAAGLAALGQGRVGGSCLRRHGAQSRCSSSEFSSP